MELTSVAVFALLMVVRPLEASPGACLSEMTKDSPTVVVCNFTRNICNNYKNFALSCASNGQDLTRMLTCYYDRDGNVNCRKQNECTYEVTTDTLLLGLNVSPQNDSHLKCLVQTTSPADSPLPCYVKNATVTTTQPSPSSTHTAVVYKTNRPEQDYSGQSAKVRSGQQAPADISHNNTSKRTLWTDTFVGMVVALVSMVILLGVVVALWLRDRRRLKMKYSPQPACAERMLSKPADV